MSVDDNIISEILYGASNLLIIGPGGTGKSYLIRNAIANLSEKVAEATAATGVAAVNINGTTLHRFFGVGLCQGEIEQILGRVRRNPGAMARIRTTEILFIDEISMVGDELFGTLDLIARQIRRSSEPFGGMRLVLSGDFLQLPPVNENWVFESNVWKKLALKTFFMNEPRRFTDDAFYRTLMRVREGILTPRDVSQINQRIKAYNKYMRSKDPPAVKPTIVYSLRADVDAINQKEMNKLPGEAKSYQAMDSLTAVKGAVTLDQYTQQLDYMAPKVLTLKVGAQVMLTWNLNVEEDLCNGTRGVITKLDTETISIQTKNGQELTIERMNFQLEDKKATVIRSQFPLILAFALTIHKCQGSTLDFCVVDIGPNVFAPGQAYVALSRARSWDSLLISNFTKGAIKADPKALRYVTDLEEGED